MCVCVDRLLSAFKVAKEVRVVMASGKVSEWIGGDGNCHSAVPKQNGEGVIFSKPTSRIRLLNCKVGIYLVFKEVLNYSSQTFLCLHGGGHQ